MTTQKNQNFKILVEIWYTQFSIAFLHSQKLSFLKNSKNSSTYIQKHIKNIDQNKKYKNPKLHCPTPCPNEEFIVRIKWV